MREAAKVIIPDPNDLLVPVDDNPDRPPVASCATTFGRILMTTGIKPRSALVSAPKTTMFGLCQHL